MDIKELAFNKLTKEEQVKWKLLKDKVYACCDKDIQKEYGSIIENALKNVLIDDHIAGYSMEHGYYYVIEGDYGELTLDCLTQDINEIAFYILKSIYYSVASDIELKNRVELQKFWKYYHERNSLNTESWAKNSNYRFNSYYDPRKYVFEFVLARLAKTFDGIQLTYAIKEYTDYLNIWFDEPHWKYNAETLVFDEASQSVDKRFKKENDNKE